METLVKKSPHNILREKSEPVTDFSTLDMFLLPQMKQAMTELNGIGISAVQIGSLKQVFLYRDADFNIHVVCNPEIISYGKKTVKMLEGCLSIDDVLYDIERPEKIKVRYYNEQGQPVEQRLSGMDARVFQHEFDHLHGIMMGTRSICDQAMIDAMMEHDNDVAVQIEVDVDLEEDTFSTVFIRAFLKRYSQSGAIVMSFGQVKALIDQDFPLGVVSFVRLVPDADLHSSLSDELSHGFERPAE